MRKFLSYGKEWGLAILLFILNTLFIVQVFGIEVEPFHWSAFAQPYQGVTAVLRSHTP